MVLARHMSRHPPAAFARSRHRVPSLFCVLPLSAGHQAGEVPVADQGSVPSDAVRSVRVASDLRPPNPSGKRCVLSQIDQALRIPLTVHLGCVCVCVCVCVRHDGGGKDLVPGLVSKLRISVVEAAVI